MLKEDIVYRMIKPLLVELESDEDPLVVYAYLENMEWVILYKPQYMLNPSCDLKHEVAYAVQKLAEFHTVMDSLVTRYGNDQIMLWANQHYKSIDYIGHISHRGVP